MERKQFRCTMRRVDNSMNTIDADEELFTLVKE